MQKHNGQVQFIFVCDHMLPGWLYTSITWHQFYLMENHGLSYGLVSISCIGVNLGPSPNHAQTVNLVVNLNTGLVSPQFCCRYDDFFETICRSHQDTMMHANWKQLAGFIKYDGTPTVHDRLSRTDQLVVAVGTNFITHEANTANISQDGHSEVDSGLNDDFPDPMQDSVGAHDEPLSGVTNVLPSAGISSRGHIRRMSQAMQNSVAQCDS
ncbi:hypothetical protein ACHAW6_006364 [Cyclotella cf. meneghiniana]